MRVGEEMEFSRKNHGGVHKSDFLLTKLLQLQLRSLPIALAENGSDYTPFPPSTASQIQITCSIKGEHNHLIAVW